MRLRVVVVGDDAKDPLVQLAADYLKRAGRRYDAGLVALKPEKRGKGADDEKVRALEADALLKASEGCCRIALDAEGKLYSSEDFSALVEDKLAQGRPLAFLIGGATGLGDEVRRAADVTLSLSRMTFPHKLALLVLAEQIYRAHEISRGGPYHK